MKTLTLEEVMKEFKRIGIDVPGEVCTIRLGEDGFHLQLKGCRDLDYLDKKHLARVLLGLSDNEGWESFFRALSIPIKKLDRKVWQDFEYCPVCEGDIIYVPGSTLPFRCERCGSKYSAPDYIENERHEYNRRLQIAATVASGLANGRQSLNDDESRAIAESAVSRATALIHENEACYVYETPHEAARRRKCMAASRREGRENPHNESDQRIPVDYKQNLEDLCKTILLKTSEASEICDRNRKGGTSDLLCRNLVGRADMAREIADCARAAMEETEE